MPTVFFCQQLTPKKAISTAFGVDTTLPTVRPTQLNTLQAQKLKEEGNRLIQLQMWDEALQHYGQAVALMPEYTDAWFNMHTAYNHLGQQTEAVWALQSLLKINPADHEARCLLAQHLIDLGQPREALTHYQSVLNQAPNFDPAKRLYSYVNNRILALSQPQLAQEQYRQKAQNNILAAKGVLIAFYNQQAQPHKIELLKQTPLVFEDTQTRSNTNNLAEYDAPNGRIRLSPQLAYADPVVLAACMAHELEHAADNDNLTSLWEEQDAYRVMVKIWQQFRQNPNTGQSVQDPNLDTSLNLYEQSPNKLYQAVDQTYQRIDPTIPQQSPGHGLPPSLGQDPWAWQQYLIQRGQEITDRYRDLLTEQAKAHLP
jgi:tetratricopeptide (TPR) repeat protein